MKNLLLLGKNVEVVRLQLDDTALALTDELGRLWLDVCFDDRALLVDKTVRQDNQFMTLKNLLSANFQVLASGEDLAPEVWYEIGLRGQAKILRPSTSRNVFTEPEFYPDWLVLDRSVRLSDDDQARLLNFVTDAPSVRLVTINSWSSNLLERANLVLFDRPQADLATVKSLAKRAQLSENRLLVVVADKTCFLADSQRIVEVDRPTDFPVIEIYNCLLKLADFDLDTEDQARLLVWLMEEISAGREIDWTSVAAQLDSLPAVQVVAGEVDHVKHLKQFANRLTNSGQTWVDLSQTLDLSANEYQGFIDNLLKTKDLAEFSGVILLGSEIGAGQLKKIDKLTLGVSCQTGFESMPGFDGELVTAGLDGLAGRLSSYRQAGVQMALWPIKYSLSQESPHDAIILSNSHIATRFAKMAQERGLLPIIQLIVQGCDKAKFNRIVESLLAEMKLFQVDYNSLGVLITAPDCSELSTQALRDQGVLVIRQDQPTIAGEIKSHTQVFKSLYRLPNQTDDQAQVLRTKFAEKLRQLAKN